MHAVCPDIKNRFYCCCRCWQLSLLIKTVCITTIPTIVNVIIVVRHPCCMPQGKLKISKKPLDLFLVICMYECITNALNVSQQFDLLRSFLTPTCGVTLMFSHDLHKNVFYLFVFEGTMFKHVCSFVCMK